MKLYTPLRSASIKAPGTGTIRGGKVSAGPRMKMGTVRLKTIKAVSAKGAKVKL